MNDYVRQQLIELIEQFGKSVYVDTTRCEALIRDLCGDNKAEINALVAVLKGGMVEELIKPQNQMPIELKISYISGRLQSNFALSIEAADWSVESWAQALGLIERRPPKRSRSTSKLNKKTQTSSADWAKQGRIDLQGHSGWVFSVKFGYDRDFLATGGEDSLIKIWDVNTGHELNAMEQEGKIYDICISSDSKFLTSVGDDGKVLVREIHSGRQIGNYEFNEPLTSISFCADGEIIAIGCHSGNVHILEMSTGAEKWQAKNTSPVRNVTFSPNGQLLACSSNNITNLWLVSNQQVIGLLEHNDTVRDVSFSPDGNMLATVCGTLITVWDIFHLHRVRAWESHLYSAWTVTFGSNQNQLYSGGYDGMIRLWDTSTGNEMEALEQTGLVRDIALSPDGKILASAAADRVQLWWIG